MRVCQDEVGLVPRLIDWKYLELKIFANYQPAILHTDRRASDDRHILTWRSISLPLLHTYPKQIAVNLPANIDRVAPIYSLEVDDDNTDRVHYLLIDRTEGNLTSGTGLRLVGAANRSTIAKD